MPCVEFEHTFAAFERAKTVHVLDRAANVIGGDLAYVRVIITLVDWIFGIVDLFNDALYQRYLW
jgi:hypothetical protein